MAELLLFHVVSMDGFGQIAGLAPQTMARQNEDPNSGMVSSVSKVSVLYDINKHCRMCHYKLAIHHIYDATLCVGREKRTLD